jgi:hypothetical protein
MSDVHFRWVPEFMSGLLAGSNGIFYDFGYGWEYKRVEYLTFDAGQAGEWRIPVTISNRCCLF